MFAFLPALVNKFLPIIAMCAARRRKAAYAERQARHRQARFVQPNLEHLEDRFAPAVLTFDGGVNHNDSNWFNQQDWVNGAGQRGNLPGANDTAIIDVGVTCNLNGSTTVQDLTVNGSLTVSAALTVAANGNAGSGTTTVAFGGSVLIGGPNSSDAASLDTNTFSDSGTTTVGSPSATGSTATLDAVFASIADGGLLNIGDPNSGTAGTVDVSKTMAVNGGTVQVGGANGSGGTLGVYTLTSTGVAIVNENGQMNIESSGALTGNTTVSGKLQAETGVPVTLGGTGTVGGGNGKLVAEINASIDFAKGSTWTILPGDPPGSALNEGNFIIDGTLLDDTSLTPDGDITLDATGALGGTGNLTIGKSMTWTGGILAPEGGTQIIGELTASGSDTKELQSNLVTNSLSVELGGTGPLILMDNAVFTVATGTVTVSLPTIGSYYGGSLVNGAGTLDIETPSTDPLLIDCDFTNDQYLEVAAGYGMVLENSSGSGLTMNLDGTLLLDGEITLEGDISSPTGFSMGPGGGTLYVGSDYDSGTLTLPSGVTAVLTGGTLEVTSGSTLTGAGSINNSSATLKLDSSSSAGVENYTQSPSGTLELEESGMDDPTLGLAGDANLAGTLTMDFVDGYTPSSGTMFTVLTANGVNGTFNVTPQNMTVAYNPTSVTLTQN